jgi:excisionase family DNA binding protein
MDKLHEYLRIKEAAEYLGVSPNTLRNWGRAQKIAEHRHPVNNYRLYKRADLDRLLRVTEKHRTRR